MARWDGGEFWRDMTRYLFSNPSRTISCSVSGANSPDHNVMLPSNCKEEGGSTFPFNLVEMIPSKLAPIPAADAGNYEYYLNTAPELTLVECIFC